MKQGLTCTRGETLADNSKSIEEFWAKEKVGIREMGKCSESRESID
jgi:hypothetical protein